MAVAILGILVGGGLGSLFFIGFIRLLVPTMRAT